MNLTIDLKESTKYTAFTEKQTEVLIDYQNCKITEFKVTQIKCTLPENQKNTPNLTAGNHQVKVLIKTIGYLPEAAGIMKIQKTLSATKLTPSAGSPKGGTTVIIEGDGFPLTQ